MTEDALPIQLAADARVDVPLDASVASGWAAYLQPELRRRWFRLPGRTERDELDVREGGHHLLTGTFRLDDRTEALDARCRFLEIVPLDRVVWTYEVRVDGVLRSVSLCVTRLHDGARTELEHEEQFVVFAPTEAAAAAGVAERRGGLRLQLNGWRAVAQEAESASAGDP